jgi:uncharacterized protein YbcC (UPF0753/DUF2309 family)
MITITTPDAAVTSKKLPEDRSTRLEAAIAGATRRIAPLWPLRHFVAVNPFLGFTDQAFETTCATMQRVNRLSMLMPRAFYREALSSGVIDICDLEHALQTASLGGHENCSMTELLHALDAVSPSQGKPAAVVATVAEILDRLSAGDRQSSRTDFMIAEISKWCAAYFDEGQSVWRLPSRGMPIYQAWRNSMQHDRNPEIMGVRHFRTVVKGMPEDPVATIAQVV